MTLLGRRPPTPSSRVLAVAIAVATAVSSQGCRLKTAGLLDVDAGADPALDAATTAADARAPDGGGGLVDGSAGDAFPEAAPPGTCLPWLLWCDLSRSCVGACGGCRNAVADHVIGCFECVGLNPPAGRCVANDNSACTQRSYPHCRCDLGLLACPGATQVCVSGECRTCGESGTDDEQCRGGGSCETSQNNQCR